MGDALWSARLLADDPDLVREVHADYLLAGADVITSASYQATLAGFERRGMNRPRARTLIGRSVGLAREARDRFWDRGAGESHRAEGRIKPQIAASIGPYGAFLADGSEYTGTYDLREAALGEFHRERLALLSAQGPDLLACETIPSRAEARTLARLLVETPGPAAWMSFSCADRGRLADGSDLAEVAAEVAEIGGGRLVALGVNCVPPSEVTELLERLRAAWPGPLVAYPNSGERYDAVRKRWTGRADELAESAAAWRAAGAALIGGCCRTGPRHTTALRRCLAGS